MSLHNPMITYTSIRASASTGTVSDSTTSYELPINYQHKGLHLSVERTAETGTCTLVVTVEFYSPNAGEWMEVEGATFTFADGATGNRHMIMYPGMTAADSDANIALDTAEQYLVNGYLPQKPRVSFTSGGTSVANTFSAECWYLP